MHEKFTKWGIRIIIFGFPLFLLLYGTTKFTYLNYKAWKAQSIARQWSEYHYDSLNDPALPAKTEDLVARTTESFLLADTQQAALADEIQKFFRAYSDGSFEVYRSFRMPAGVACRLKPSKWGSIEKWLGNAKVPNSFLASAPLEKKFQAYLTIHNGDRLVFANYFTGVAIGDSRIVAREYSQELPKPWEIPFLPAPIKADGDLAVKVSFPNLGYFSQKEEFTYLEFSDDAIETVKNKNGVVLVADCLLFMDRTDYGTIVPKLPVILRLYWVPQKKEWLPDDLVVCNAMERKGKVPIF